MFTRRTHRPLLLSLLTAATVALSSVLVTAASADAAGPATLTVAPAQGASATVAAGKSDRSAVAFTLDTFPESGGSIYLGARTRVAGKAYYMLQARVLSSGKLTITVKRRDVDGRFVDLTDPRRPDVTASPGDRLLIDLAAAGASPVSLSGVVKNLTTGAEDSVGVSDRSDRRLPATGSADAWAYGSASAKAKQTVRVEEYAPTTVAEPAEPEAEPAAPDAEPADPEVEPGAPEVSPAEPETKPTTPAEPETGPTAPSEPETQPTQPEVHPKPEPEPTPDPTPETPGKPGVPAGTKLKVHQGDLIITKPNTVVSGLDIRGFVRVNAPGAVIENSKISGRTTKSAVGIVSNYNNGNSFTIRNSEIYSASPNPYLNGIMGHNFTATNVWVHDVIDSVRITGSNVTVSHSLLEDNLHFTKDPTQNNTPSHDDSIQIQGGSNIKITDNRISGAFNAAIQITQGLGRVSNVLIKGNHLDGGGCTVNIAEIGGGAITGTVLESNTFGKDRRVADCGVVAPTSSYPKMTGNLWESTGKSVGVTRGN